MIMIVYDLIQQVDDQVIADTIERLYPNDKKRIEEVLAELRQTSPAENCNHTTIHVQYVKEHERSERYLWHATYSIDRRYHHQYSLQYLSKSQILSAEVLESDLAVLPKEEYLVHLLFDLAREEEIDEELQCVEPKAHLPHFANP